MCHLQLIRSEISQLIISLPFLIDLNSIELHPKSILMRLVIMIVLVIRETILIENCDFSKLFFYLFL